MKLKRLSVTVMVAAMMLSIGSAGYAGKSSKSIPEVLRQHGFKHQTASWTTVSTSKDSKGKVTKTTGKMWLKGNKYRLETKDKKQNKTTVFIDDGKERIVYMPEDKKAIKWSKEMESMYGGLMNSDVVAESARQRANAKKAGTGKVDGKKCTIYTYKSTLTYMNSKVTSDVKEWVWKKESIPLKSIVKTPKHKMQMGFMAVDVPASESTTEIKDIVLDKKIKDSLFTVPTGTKIETMSSAMQSRPKMKKSSGKKSTPKAPKKGEQEIPAEVQDMLKGLF